MVVGGKKRKRPGSWRRRQVAVEKKLRSIDKLRTGFAPSLSLRRRNWILPFSRGWVCGSSPASSWITRSDPTSSIAVFLENYNRASKLSVIGGFRIKIGRANLARASKLPVKNIKQGAATAKAKAKAVEEEELAVVAAVEEFCSCYVLLHNESGWTMPDEVSNWLRVVKDIWAFAEA